MEKKERVKLEILCQMQFENSENVDTSSRAPWLHVLILFPDDKGNQYLTNTNIFLSSTVRFPVFFNMSVASR